MTETATTATPSDDCAFVAEKFSGVGGRCPCAASAVGRWLGRLERWVELAQFAGACQANGVVGVDWEMFGEDRA